MSKFQVGDLLLPKRPQLFEYNLWVYRVQQVDEYHYVVARFYPKSRSENKYETEDIEDSCIPCPNMVKLLVGIRE